MTTMKCLDIGEVVQACAAGEHVECFDQTILQWTTHREGVQSLCTLIGKGYLARLAPKPEQVDPAPEPAIPAAQEGPPLEIGRVQSMILIGEKEDGTPQVTFFQHARGLELQVGLSFADEPPIHRQEVYQTTKALLMELSTFLRNKSYDLVGKGREVEQEPVEDKKKFSKVYKPGESQ
jgi:hypothetical protein